MDAIALLSWAFLGGPAPPAPFPDCGPGLLAGDPALGCEDTHVQTTILLAGIFGIGPIPCRAKPCR